MIIILNLLFGVNINLNLYEQQFFVLLLVKCEFMQPAIREEKKVKVC